MSRLEILYPYPALLMTGTNEDYLIISDLHIGFEQRFNIKTSCNKMLNMLLELLYQYRPDRLLILGDVKSGFNRLSKVEWMHVPKFMEDVASLVRISVIPGNHDGNLAPLLPREVMIESKEVLLDNVGFLHGHTKLSRRLNGASRIVMGHIHPSYCRKGSPLSGAQVWLIVKVLRTGIFEGSESCDNVELWVMPSFNTELNVKGLTLSSKKLISPIFRKIAKNMEDAFIITLDGSVIGDIDSVKFVL